MQGQSSNHEISSRRGFGRTVSLRGYCDLAIKSDPCTDAVEDVIRCPVAFQLVGQRLNEEYLMGVTRKCDEALRELHDG